LQLGLAFDILNESPKASGKLWQQDEKDCKDLAIVQQI
jgi:hypothetical protein